jgi:FKBP-type peptidyl-prolyl cis-trans isomerase
LEDDEKEPGTKSFQTVVGSAFNIAALNDGVLGMHIGGTRRFSILPQKGWEKPTAMCDGGPGGKLVFNVIFCCKDAPSVADDEADDD